MRNTHQVGARDSLRQCVTRLLRSGGAKLRVAARAWAQAASGVLPAPRARRPQHGTRTQTARDLLADLYAVRGA